VIEDSVSDDELAEDWVSELEDDDNEGVELIEDWTSEVEDGDGEGVADAKDAEEGIVESTEDNDDEPSVLEDIAIELVTTNALDEDDVGVADERTLVDEETLDEDTLLQSPKPFWQLWTPQ
jgi:hypothetical protein